MAASEPPAGDGAMDTAASDDGLVDGMADGEPAAGDTAMDAAIADGEHDLDPAGDARPTVDAEPDALPPECRDGDSRQCGRAVGVCFIAVQGCVGGRWAPCEGLARQGPEACNGEDDDCDNVVDEALPDRETTCGVGTCAVTGLWTCREGSADDSCSPGEPGEERCNGMDDDCDGLADEDGAALCVRGDSPCQQGDCSEGGCVYPADGDPCASTLPCGVRGHACYGEQCGCDCGLEEAGDLDPVALRFDMNGIAGFGGPAVYEFRTVDGRSSGPVACLADWQAALEGVGLLPPGEALRAQSLPLEVTIRRACGASFPSASEQALIAMAEQYEAAHSYWHALRVTNRQAGSLIRSNRNGAQLDRLNLSNTMVTDFQPRGQCVDHSTLVLDARSLDRQAISSFGIGRVGEMRVEHAGGAIDVQYDLSNWNPALIPHGAPLTVTLVNPCSDAGERFYFGRRDLYDEFERGGTIYPEFRASFYNPDNYYRLEGWIDLGGDLDVFLYMDESTIDSYRPAYDQCVDEETIVVRGNHHAPWQND